MQPTASPVPTFPNYAGKHDDRCLINPDAFVEYHRTEGAYRDIEAPRAAILCYHRGLAEHLRATHEMHVIPGFFGDTMLLEEAGREVALVANFGIGSPIAAVMLEDLIALGAREVISIGTTGALQPGMNIGDIVVCDRAIRDEGTSHHYLPPARHVDAGAALTTRVQTVLDDMGIAYRTGTSWTVDAPYRETVGEARHYREEGVVCVEMEAAALFAVAQHRGIEVASMLTVSDSLAELEWAPAFHSDETMNGLEQLFEAAVRVLR